MGIQLPASPHHAKSDSVQINIDDGQSIQLSNGAYVGRFPSKGGLPPGYDGVVVRGEHVSRVHWALDILAGQQLSIRDMGSSSGTFLDPPDHHGQPVEVPAGSSMPITPGSVIHFGDRWARIG